jgi:hypothetical protein
MANYIIGIDFGTYQTKVCVNHLDSYPEQFEFFQFNIEEHESLFMHSKVYLLKNGKFKFGSYNGADIDSVFNYFKIASAEDERFRVVSNLDGPIYNQEENFKNTTPEFLSVIFITHVLLKVRSHYNKQLKTGTSTGLKGLFSRLQRTKDEKHTFSVRLGIPTEYSKEANLLRRRKFETILLISEMLQLKINFSEDTFASFSKNDMEYEIAQILNEVTLISTDFDTVLNEQYRISVYPESAAGLLYFSKSGKLEAGLYAAIDIGGGTSDISYFNVQNDKKIMYLASESFMMACNNIYMDYNCSTNNTLEEVKRTEEFISNKINSKTWKDDLKYLKAVKKVKVNIDERMKFLFGKTVFTQLGRFTPSQIKKNYNYQPCLIYGGGLFHPMVAEWGEICIFDSGVLGTLSESQNTLLKAKDVNLYIPDSSIIKNKGWEKYFSLLIVAFGLSNLQHKDESYWDDHDYRCINIKYIIEEVQHPRNEGMYIYNVLERKWNV